MIILKVNFGRTNIRVSPDTTDPKEEVCVDLSVGESYMEAGTSEAFATKEYYQLKPGRCIVVRTAEQVTVPNDAFGFLCSKGSLAARGLLVPNTKIDPLFSDHLEVAIYNAGKSVLPIEKGMKFCSIVFLKADGHIKSNVGRHAPRISTDKRNKIVAFLTENAVLLVTSLVTIILSVLLTWITIKTQSH